MKCRIVFVMCFLGISFLGAQEAPDSGLYATDDPAARTPPASSGLPGDEAEGAASDETGELAADAAPNEAGGLSEGAASGAADELAADAEDLDEAAIPPSLKNNRFYQESLRHTNLARLSFAEGDYGQSALYSEEAARLARLSDEYINEKLSYAKAARLLEEARKRLAWADASGAAEYYPAEAETARADYARALAARGAADWNEAARFARRTIDDLEGVAAPPPKDAPPAAQPAAPTQYRVRPWDIFGDCLWNIAARFYGNPRYWPVLYRANKSKLPEEDNPDLLETGTLLDIPDIEGEARRGVYDSGLPYAGDNEGGGD